MEKNDTSNMDHVDRLKNLVTLEKASELTGIAVKTFRNWRSRGVYSEIFVKLGGCLRIDLTEFVKVIDRNAERTANHGKRLKKYKI